MRIRVDKEKCSGCGLCEMVCSLFHTGAINPEKSAVRIERDDTDPGAHVPLVCRQCRNTVCLEGEDADKSAEKKKFRWDPARAGRCPFRSLSVCDGYAYHCNLCGGNPRCISVCTPNALFLGKGDEGLSR